MKSKKIFNVFAAIMIVAVAVCNVGLSSKIERISGLTLANTEVLANNEGTGSGGCVQSIQQFDYYDPYCGFYEAVLNYNCAGDAAASCSKGFERHYYDCNGSWLGFDDCTSIVSCQ